MEASGSRSFENLWALIDFDELSRDFRSLISEIIKNKKLNFDYPQDDQIKQRLENFLRVIFLNPRSEEALKACRQVGEVHFKYGVPLSYMILAFEGLLANTFKQIRSKAKNDMCCLCELSLKVVIQAASQIAQTYHELALSEKDAYLHKLSRLNEMHKLLRKINIAVSGKFDSEEEFFKKLCKIMTTHPSFVLSWAGLLSEDGENLVPVACSDSVAECEDLLRNFRPKIKDYIKAGLEKEISDIFSGRVVVIRNLDKYLPAGRDRFREALYRLKVKNAITLPVQYENRIIGAIIIYSSEDYVPEEEERKLLQELARDISLGWMHLVKSKELEKMIFTDELTGLGNLRFLMGILEHEIKLAQKTGMKLAIISVDIKEMSKINHFYGFHTGDLVLKETAHRLSLIAGDHATVVRAGPDDFIVSFPFKNDHELREFIMRLKESLQAPIELEKDSIKIEVIIGVSVFPDDGSTRNELLEKSRIALKKAQEEDLDFAAFYSDRRTIEVVKRYGMLKELERAFENGEFELFYQPKINIVEREISGFEALLRWRHPERGIVPPAEFITVLEESGLMVDVGYWVVEKAAEFFRKLRQRGFSLRVSFNVSVGQISQPNFAERVAEILKRLQVPPRTMEAEITERIMLKMGERMGHTIAKLKELGLNVAIDDFGTGYSSIVYLKSIPIDVVKIDKTFIRGIPDDRRNVDIVIAIANLAKSLKKKTVAEGVETREQLALLTGIGIDEIQGFYFAKPMPEDQALSFAEKTYAIKKDEFFWRRHPT